MSDANERVQRILDSGYSRASKIAASVRVLAGIKPEMTYEEIEVTERLLAAERADGVRAVVGMLRERAALLKSRGARLAWIELEAAAASIEQKADQL